jgi:hypothetical protein
MATMTKCAIAMVDALGMRGSWRGPNGADDYRVLDTLSAAGAAAYGIRDYVNGALRAVFVNHFDVEPTVRVLSISDTIVIAAFGAADPGEKQAWGLVDLVSQGAAYVMRKAALTDRPLVYRGVVNFGRMLMSPDGFLLGPCVDEAAEAYETAEGAFIWLMPDADRLEAHEYEPHVWRTMAFEYDVPLKGGRTIRTTTLSPFVDTHDPRERAKIRNGYETAMASSRVDITVKRQNTLRFLDHVEQVQKPEIDKLYAHLGR